MKKITLEAGQLDTLRYHAGEYHAWVVTAQLLLRLGVRKTAACGFALAHRREIERVTG